MSRVMELEEQIRKLQEEKSRIYSEERKAALSEIKEKIALFDFTAKELGLKGVKAAGRRKSGKEGKIASKSTTKKAVRKAARKASKGSGLYYDLDGRKVSVGRGRPPREVTAYAMAKGIPVENLKRNADGSPFKK